MKRKQILFEGTYTLPMIGAEWYAVNGPDPSPMIEHYNATPEVACPDLSYEYPTDLFIGDE
eukprot:4503130-Karenia_brevis.AAC.1